MDWPTAAMWITSVVGAFLPVLASRWQVLAALTSAAGALIVLGGYLCADFGHHPGLEGLICFLIPFIALVLGCSSTVVGICRCVDHARVWAWGRFPGLMLPVVVAYGVPLIAWALLID